MIARALMHAPQVLFLDEPSTGLDPAARLFVWDRLRDLQSRGVTLLLTTHDMDEAAALSDRVGIMDHGRLLALDTPAALVRSLPGSATLDLTAQGCDPAVEPDLLSALDRLPQVERVDRIDAQSAADDRGSEVRMRLYITGDAPLLVAPAASLVTDRGLRLTDVRLGALTLEDVFLHLTGRVLR
jgi:ABC-2 type transport system ATP-binding protein